ncbi:MAG: carbohydrate ABC transporter permease [Chthonomonas sp.]|nr:carbohydrate ABC transporter permease [Chthonomonas sp.]
MRATRILVTILLIAGSLVFLAPFLMSISLSLKTAGEISTTSVWSPPQNPTLNNYKEVLSNPNMSFGRFFQNTLLIATLATLGTVLSAALVAYPFARLKFKGRDRLFVLLLSTMMLPGVVTLIPTFVLFKHLHWINTYLPLIVPAYLGGGAFNIFLIRQFMMGLPRDLDEAATLDGASHMQIFWRILFPLCGPVIATVGVFSFIGAWRDFMGPLLYLNDVDKQTLELGLSTFNSQFNAQWHLLMPGTVLVTIPLIIIFILGQRYFVKGISMTGMK